jgi:hypothetical protein
LKYFSDAEQTKLALDKWPELEMQVEQRQPFCDDTARLTVTVVLRNSQRANIDHGDLWVLVVADDEDNVASICKFV